MAIDIVCIVSIGLASDDVNRTSHVNTPKLVLIIERPEFNRLNLSLTG